MKEVPKLSKEVMLSYYQDAQFLGLIHSGINICDAEKIVNDLKANRHLWFNVKVLRSKIKGELDGKDYKNVIILWIHTRIKDSENLYNLIRDWQPKKIALVPNNQDSDQVLEILFYK